MQTLAWVIAFLLALTPAASTYAKDETSALRGSRFFRSYCVVCHGIDGKGGGPLANKLNLSPADLSAAKYQAQEIGDLTHTIAGYGQKSATKMPRWGGVLGKPDLRDIAAYIPRLNQNALMYSGDARRGSTIFKAACVACHGQLGEGRGLLAGLLDLPMTDYTESEELYDISDGELMHIIREGKGNYMPPWKEVLDDSEIADVASYVRRLSAIARTEDSSTQYRPNPEAGKNLYRTYCVVCHGVHGKGDGPLAKKLTVAPVDLTGERYQAKRAADLADIIGGYVKKEHENMPSWGKVLAMPDLQDIAAYALKLGENDLRFKGDSRHGRVVYKHACVACHGRFGKGQGVLAKLIKILMIDFTNSEDMAQFSDEELIDIVRHGKGDYMPSWKRELDDRDIIDVASYVRGLAR